MAETGWSKGGVIATWLAVALTLFQIWQTWPKSEGAATPVRAWIIPAALIGALLLAAGLHLAASLVARGKKQKPLSEGQELTPANQVEAESLKWLQNYAEQQAQAINQFVIAIKLEFTARVEMLRDNPYGELELTVDNRSVFDITLDDAKGTLSFMNREISQPMRWVTRDRLVKKGSTSVLTLRQDFIPADVTHMMSYDMNLINLLHYRFDLSRLDIHLRGVEGVTPNVEPKPLSIGLQLDHAELYRRHAMEVEESRRRT